MYCPHTHPPHNRRVQITHSLPSLLLLLPFIPSTMLLLCTTLALSGSSTPFRGNNDVLHSSRSYDHSAMRTALGYDSCPSQSEGVPSHGVPYPSTFALSVLLCAVSCTLAVLVWFRYNSLEIKITHENNTTTQGPATRASLVSTPTLQKDRLGAWTPGARRSSTALSASQLPTEVPALSPKLKTTTLHVGTPLTSNRCWVSYFICLTLFFILNSIVCGVRSIGDGTTKSLALLCVALASLESCATLALSVALLYQLTYRSSWEESRKHFAATPATPQLSPSISVATGQLQSSFYSKSGGRPALPVYSPSFGRNSVDSTASDVSAPKQATASTGLRASGFSPYGSYNSSRERTVGGVSQSSESPLTDEMAPPAAGVFETLRGAVVPYSWPLAVWCVLCIVVAVWATPGIGLPEHTWNATDTDDPAPSEGAGYDTKIPNNGQYWLYVVVVLAQRLPVFVFGAQIIFPGIGGGVGGGGGGGSGGVQQFNPESLPSRSARVLLGAAILLDLPHMYENKR